MSVVESVITGAYDRVRRLHYENPLVTKDLRTRMRGARAHWLMLGYVLLLGICAFFTYYFMWVNEAHSPMSWMNMRVGFRVFEVITWCQAILIALIAPSLTAGSLTIENEQQTIEMLSMTTLSPWNIIAGKLTSPMLFILMLLGISLPLSAVCLAFGSISPLEIAMTYLLLIGCAFLFCSLGVFFSSLFKKTSGASMVTISCVAAFSVFVISLTAPMHYSHYGSGWQFIYTALAPPIGLNCALDSGPVFGFKLPFTLVALLNNVGLGVLLMLAASTNVKYHRSDRTLPIRSLLGGLLLWSLLLILGNTIKPGSGIGDDYHIFAFTFLLIPVMALIPLFSTGSLARNNNLLSDVLKGAVYRKLKEGTPTGGLWYMAVLFALGMIVLLITLIYDSTSSSGSGAWNTNPAGAVTAGIALLAVVVGFSAFGIMASSLARNRAGAVALTFAFMGIVWVAYPSMSFWISTSDNFLGWAATTGIEWQLAYLWPGTPIAAIDSKWIQGTNAPNLLLPKELLWLGFVIAWGAVTYACLWIASKQKACGRGIVEEE